MKAPDEIKKGLECCKEDECFGEKENCPYTADPSLCVGVMCADTIAIIQQLETDKQQLEGMLTHMNQLRDAAARRALKMEERVHQLEAERDAAVADMKNSRDCQCCKHYDVKWDEPCVHCDNDNNYFEWRGVHKEDSDDPQATD